MSRQQYVQVCACGCGQPTLLAIKTRRGHVAGQPIGRLQNHRSKRPMEFIVNIETGCWEWLGHVCPKGYGQVGKGGKVVPAHRASYEQRVGPIPEGLQLDHLCEIKCCINPDHLEPVTASENQRRAAASRKRAAHE